MSLVSSIQEIARLEPHCNGTHDCPNGVFCGSINFSACGRIEQLKGAHHLSRNLTAAQLLEQLVTAPERKRLAALKKSQEIEEERLLQIQLENQRVQNELKRQETSRLLENEKIIIPAVVTTSILLPLGIIGLFLYSRTARK